MRGYISYFKLQIINGLQYKTAAIAGVSTQFFWGFITIFLFEAFYLSGNSNQPINFEQLVPYIWLTQAFLALTYLMDEKDITESIKNGNVCYELTKPYNIYYFWYIKILAKRYAAAMLRFLPVIIISVLLPAPYNLTAPLSLLNFIIFVISLLLGTFILSGLTMLIIVFTFYNYTGDGIADIIYIISRLLIGVVIPLPFLPDFIKNATYFLPFRLIGDLSFRIYTGNMPINEAIISVILQITWIIGMIIIGNALIQKATRRIYIQGG
jgi:ABC-2 type transport system permease protein